MDLILPAPSISNSFSPYSGLSYYPLYERIRICKEAESRAYLQRARGWLCGPQTRTRHSAAVRLSSCGYVQAFAASALPRAAH